MAKSKCQASTLSAVRHSAASWKLTKNYSPATLWIKINVKSELDTFFSCGFKLEKKRVRCSPFSRIINWLLIEYIRTGVYIFVAQKKLHHFHELAFYRLVREFFIKRSSLNFTLKLKQITIFFEKYKSKISKKQLTHSRTRKVESFVPKKRLCHSDFLFTKHMFAGTIFFFVEVNLSWCSFLCRRFLVFVKVKHVSVRQSKWITEWYVKLYRFNYWLHRARLRVYAVCIAAMSITLALRTFFVHQRKTTQSVFFKTRLTTKSDDTQKCTDHYHKRLWRSLRI